MAKVGSRGCLASDLVPHRAGRATRGFCRGLCSRPGLASTLAHDLERAFTNKKDAETVEEDIEQGEVAKEERATHKQANGDKYNAGDNVLHDEPPAGIKHSRGKSDLASRARGSARLTVT